MKKINRPMDKLTFTVPLTNKEHKFAQEFYQYHDNPQKAKQIYLNTLGIQAVNFYLKCLGIETDLEESQSWNPVLQTLANNADLMIVGKGRIECLPIVENSKTCPISPEVWSDRIGYIVVEFNNELTEAKLLGFVKNVEEVEKLSVDRLNSLEQLPDYLFELEELNETIEEPVFLSHWLHQIFDFGWEQIEAIFNSHQTELAFNFRDKAPVATNTNTPEISSHGIKRAKKLNLYSHEEGEQVALCIGLTPTNNSQFDISVELYPLGDRIYLPSMLQLSILDENGKSVLKAEAGNSEGLEMQFSGEQGEGFTVKIALGDFNFTESFFI